jgi:3-oxoacyl-[acyl-carrier protein] reductase
MELGLQGRSALVFGGSKGLGRGSAEALAREGVSVALIARDQANVEHAAREIANQYGVAAFGYSADVANADAVDSAITAAEQALGGSIDILVNNTGGPPPTGVIGVEPSVWSTHFQSMVLSVIRSTDRILPGMRSRGWGRIITIASTVIVEPKLTLGISSTLRSALAGWSKTLAGQVAGDGITVNLVLPGLIFTDRTRFLDGAAAGKRGVTLEEIAAENTAGIPVGRYGTTAEFGAVVAFLASQPAAYVTGTMMRVDGGLLRSV